MEVTVMTCNCSPLPGLREEVDQALRVALGPLVRELRQVDVYLARSDRETPRQYRLQMNLRPYGSAIGGLVDGESPAALRHATAEMAARARDIVLARARQAV